MFAQVLEAIKFAEDSGMPFATILGKEGYQPTRRQLAGTVFTPHRGQKQHGLSAMRMALTFPVAQKRVEGDAAGPSASTNLSPHRTIVVLGAVTFHTSDAGLQIISTQTKCECDMMEKVSYCKHTVAMEWVLRLLNPSEANGGYPGALRQVDLDGQLPALDLHVVGGLPADAGHAGAAAEPAA